MGTDRIKVFVAHNVTGAVKDGVREASLVALLEQLKQTGVVVCDPEETAIPPEDYAARFSYCLDEIRSSDAVVVDASKRLGLGVGAEMMFAKQLDISVFVICPTDSYYRRSKPADDGAHEWFHPFIYGLATKVFGSTKECSAAIEVLSASRL